MAAPTGNQFWKIRSSHGRNLLFATHDLLWKAASEYFEWCDTHPWWRNEPIKSGKGTGKLVKVYTVRPYTLSGLCIYLDASESYWKEFRKNENLSKDFLSIIERVEEIIRTQKFEGAAVGAFNGNLIARDLGMTDKKELSGSIQLVQQVTGMQFIKPTPTDSSSETSDAKT